MGKYRGIYNKKQLRNYKHNGEICENNGKIG
jgi:hypothetical protein